MKKVIKVLGYIEDSLCIISIAVMLALAFANVIGRYVLHSSISFTEEIVCALFVLISVLGTSIAVKFQSHLGLSVLTDFLPQKAQKYIKAFNCLLGFVFSILLLWLGYKFCMMQILMDSKSMTLRVPSWIYSSFLPGGMVFVSLRFVQAMICTLTDKEVL